MEEYTGKWVEDLVLLWKRKKLILAGTLLCLLAGGIYSLFIKRFYVVSALITPKDVTSASQKNAVFMGGGLLSSGILNRTETIFRSRDLAKMVVGKIQPASGFVSRRVGCRNRFMEGWKRGRASYARRWGLSVTTRDSIQERSLQNDLGNSDQLL